MDNYAADVAEILGVYFPDRVVPAALEEEAKAQATREVGWVLHREHPEVGYERKLHGNNVRGLSVDRLVDKRDGSSVDCISSEAVPGRVGYKKIIPVWVPSPADPNWIANWVQPTLELAKSPGPMRFNPGAIDPPAPPPAPSVDLAELQAQIAALMVQVADLRSTLSTAIKIVVDGNKSLERLERRVRGGVKGRLSAFGVTHLSPDPLPEDLPTSFAATSNPVQRRR